MKRAPRKSNEEAIPTGVFDTEKHDEELRASYGADNEMGYKPVFLYVERGPGQGQLVQVRQGPLVIGRASVSELRLQHPSISRRHAQVTRIGEQFYVKDLGSQNGSFVNKQRIATEIEIFPGDTLAMGNAVMKLRGPLKKGEGLDVKQVELPLKPRKTPPKTAIVTRAKSSNATKIAIFAGAVGFGLAGVLAVAFVKLPSAVSARSAASKLEQKGDDLVVAVDEVKTRVIDDAIQKKMAERMAATPSRSEESAPTYNNGPSTSPKPISVASLSREPRENASSSSSSSGGTSKRSIMAPYEKGDADESLELAQKAGDKELSGTLSKFIKTYDAANEAMVANQGGPAIKNFEAALKLDEQLSTSGNSKKGAEIRKQLSKLYTMVGFVHVKNDNNEDAKQAFAAAVKFDGSNDQAKAQLRKLGGDVPEDSPKAKKQTKASADDAFGDGDDEKPAPKKSAPKKAPKSRSQAIDDAFGD